MTDTTQREGIPTLYGGVRFRSRLEARWAAFFFDVAGWSWEYEPPIEYERMTNRDPAEIIAEMPPATREAAARLAERAAEWLAGLSQASRRDGH